MLVARACAPRAKEAVDWRTRDPVLFHGVKPNCQTTYVAGERKARGGAFQTASDRAHFYTWAAKAGT